MATRTLHSRQFARFAVLVLSAYGTVVSAEPPRWEFEVGQELPYVIEQAMTMKLDGQQAGAAETTTKQTMEMVWVVESVAADGSARMKHDIRRVTMSMTSPGAQGYTLDTASDEPPEGLAALLAPVFNALVEHDYVVTMSPRGEFSDFQAPPELLEALNNSPTSGPLAVNSTVQLMALQIATRLPAEEVVAGESWSTAGSGGEAVRLPMFGPVLAEVTYKYAGESEEDGRAVAIFEPTVRLSAAEQPASESVSASFDSRAGAGETAFDRDAGRLARSEVRQLLAFEIKANDRPLTGDIDQTTRITFGRPAPE